MLLREALMRIQKQNPNKKIVSGVEYEGNYYFFLVDEDGKSPPLGEVFYGIDSSSGKGIVLSNVTAVLKGKRVDVTPHLSRDDVAFLVKFLSKQEGGSS